ncbi:unnamed protein product [Sphacelaria rigidula]
MRPVLNLFFLFGSSVGFYATPMSGRIGTAAAVGSFAGSRLVRAVGASPTARRAEAKFSTTSMTSAEFVDKEISGNDVVIFSKSYCPFCQRTKTLFQNLNVPHAIIELDERDDGEAIQAALASKTGQVRVMLQ